MPIIEKKVFPLAPEATFKARLDKVVITEVTSEKYGKQDKFRWEFTLLEKQAFKATKIAYEVCNPPYEASALTGVFFGSPKANMTAFLKQLMSPGLAEEFAENKRNTDLLIGWEGLVSIEHVTQGEKTFANVTNPSPSEKWLGAYTGQLSLDNADPFGDDETAANIKTVQDTLN